MSHKKIVVSVSNDLNTDQRVAKMCSSLAVMGHDVMLFGRRKKDSLQLVELEYERKRLNLLFEKGPLFYAEFNIRLFFNLLISNADIFYSNDLDTLLANYMVSRLKRKKLIYDTHEIFTEVPELEGRFAKKVWKSIERIIFPRLKKVITVNDSIADFYTEKYKVKVDVVRNFPLLKTNNYESYSKLEIGLEEQCRILILQGAGINIHRGAEEAVEMMNFLENTVLFIVGNGDVIPILKQVVQDKKLESKVKFIERLPYSEMMRYTATADLGLSLDKNTNLNYYYSLPNKIMDYVAAGTPVLVSNLPEPAKLVVDYGIGKVATDHIPENLAKIVKNMLAEDFKSKCADKLKHAANILCWENEVSGIFNDFL